MSDWAWMSASNVTSTAISDALATGRGRVEGHLATDSTRRLRDQEGLVGLIAMPADRDLIGRRPVIAPSRRERPIVRAAPRRRA
jgi:hypothetical protein